MTLKALLPEPRQARSLHFSEVLMARESVTPNDAGCQAYLIYRLSKLGFHCEQHCVEGVSNLIARWGHGPVHFAFSGHTDVVPPGPLEKWNTGPFSPIVNNSVLFGRGAADMKTAIGAMLAATERAISSLDEGKISYWWLITSDEEGEAEYGSKWIKQWLDQQGVSLGMCLVGEPTASVRTGDTIKVGRRGSLSGTVFVNGKQGHVAYPHSCDNAIHRASRIIEALTTQQWETGSADFPGTSLQITHVDTGSFTDNLVPGQARVEFNVRYDSQFTQNTLRSHLSAVITKADSVADVAWSRPCEAYLSKPAVNQCLIRYCETAIRNATGRFPAISTSGGTSDGRFYASKSTQVVELGVPNKSIHQVNEHVHLSDLVTLEDIYTDILCQLAR